MKKLFKFISLLVLPLALSSCSIINSFINGGGNEQGQVTDNNVYPTSLIITGESNIVVGESTILTATYTPTNVTNKTVTWNSSNTTVASVSSSGRVKGLSDGNTTITASMKGEKNATVTATFEMTVGTPAATGVQLDKTSTTLGFGKTMQLTATVNPKHSNQNVSWSSNNQSVATVSSSGLVTAKNIAGTAVITATSEDGGFTASCQVKVQEVVGTTVMIYMCGADLESGTDDYGTAHPNQAGYASKDLNEILSVSGQPDEVNIVVETGGAKAWAKSQIPSNKLARWEIRNRQFVKKAESGQPNTDIFPANTNMGLSSTLQSFLEWGFENYQSDKYGLILWNHGGAMNGCCYDENNGDDCLTADEVYSAVTAARAKKGITDKLEWITYDACLMAVQDIAEFNSYNFNYMLSSQESEVGEGYDYDAWLPTLYNNPGINGGDLLEVIGHTFIESIDAMYYSKNHDQTQSVYDLTKINAYKTAFESIASDLNSIIGNDSDKATLLGQTIAQAREYGCDEYGDSSGFEVFDMKEALNKVKAKSEFSSISSKVTTFYNALDDLVIYEEHGTATTGCGMCIYSPWSQAYPYNYGSNEYRKSNFTEWKKVSNKIFDACYDPYGY